MTQSLLVTARASKIIDRQLCFAATNHQSIMRQKMLDKCGKWSTHSVRCFLNKLTKYLRLLYLLNIFTATDSYWDIIGMSELNSTSLPYNMNSSRPIPVIN